jgi:outer membrane protein assembly factor BamB
VLPTAVPTQPLPIGGELAATLRSSDTLVRVGPSNVYTVSATIAANTPLRLRGRTPAGDWYYACCIPNTATTFWVRSAWVNIANNALPAGAPSDADPNNPSWLAVQPIDPILVPRPTPTGIPLGDFPLARYDAANSGRVPSLPNAPLQQSWTNLQQAAQAFVSPVAVSGASVLASSQDNQYYSLDLGAGTQRWRYNLQNTTLLAPAIQDGLIYLVFGGRSILSLQDQGNSAGVIWQSDLPQNATSPFTAWLDTLFIGAGEGGEARLIAIRRSNPAERREFGEPNSRVLQPALGQETLFVGADRLWAIDANLLSLGSDLVWTSPDVVNVAVPPVYVWPGVMKLAELYVADSNGTVHALDANTGVRFWTNSPGFGVTALAVNDTSVILAGNNGVLRALSRRDGAVQWTQAVGGLVMGGPFVTNTRVLAVTQGGGIFLLDAASGGILDAAQNVQSQVPGSPAVSGLQVIVPTSSNSVYAFRGAP